MPETPYDPNVKPGQRGHLGSTYVSPHGKPEGMAQRLLDHSRILGVDKSKPWVGMGLIDDLRKAAEMLGGDPGKFPLHEARAEVFSSLARANEPTGQHAPRQPEPELEDWEKAFTPKPATEYDL